MRLYMEGRTVDMGHEPPRRSVAAVTGLQPILLQNLDVFADEARPGDFAVALFRFPMRKLRQRHIGTAS